MNAKLKMGDGFGAMSATEWNRHVDAADIVLRQSQAGMGGGRRGGSWDTNFVKCKNTSGEDRRLGEILEFTGLALDDLDGDLPLLWLEGGNPTLANGFGVLVRATPQDEIDVCQVAGACLALVNVTDASHKFAYAKKDEYVLQSASSGSIRILWKPDETGEQKCGILLGASGVQILRGKTQATLTKGSHADVKRYEAGTTTFVSPDQIDDVYNELATVATDKLVYYWQDGDKLYLLEAECPLT